VRLDKLCVRRDGPDGTHRSANRTALLHEGPDKGFDRTAVRMPDPVHAAEACGRQRFVYWRVGIDPRVPLRHLPCEPDQPVDEIGIEQPSGQRPRAVMDQSDDRPDPEFTQPTQSRVGGAPVDLPTMVMFPEDGIAKGPDAERGNTFEVVVPSIMSGPVN